MTEKAQFLGLARYYFLIDGTQSALNAEFVSFAGKIRRIFKV